MEKTAGSPSRGTSTTVSGLVRLGIHRPVSGPMVTLLLWNQNSGISSRYTKAAPVA